MLKEIYENGLTPKQIEALDTINNEHIVNIFDGAIQVGKTVMASICLTDFILNSTKPENILNRKREHNFFVIAQDKESAMDNVGYKIADILKQSGLKEVGEMNRLRNNSFKLLREKIKGKVNNKEFFIDFFGINNKKSYQQFMGRTFKGGIIDEGGLQNKIGLDKAIGRTITFQGSGAKIWITTNPMGTKNHWFYKHFIEKYNTIKFKLTDSPLFDEQMFKRAREFHGENSPVFQRDYLGNWVVGEGAIYYDNIIINNDKFDYDILTFGFDYGDQDATTGVAVAINSNKCEFRIVGQYYHSNRSQDVERKNINDYVDDSVKFINDTIKKLDADESICTIFCETNPQSFYNLMSERPEIENIVMYKVDKTKHNNKSISAISERINYTNILLKQRLLSCVDSELPVVSAFENATYNEKGARIDTVDYDIDSLDAFEYAIKEYFYLIDDYIEKKLWKVEDE